MISMISPVSFGSTYKVSANSKDSINQQLGHEKLINYCEQKQIPYEETSTCTTIKPYGSTRYTTTTTIVSPKSEDKGIETFCKNKGINFHKYETNKLMQPNDIESRTAAAPQGFRTAVINPEKLEELLKSQQNNNIAHCKSDYKKYFQDKLDFMLKSGDELPATTLYLTPINTKEDMLEYINKWGSDNLNDDSLFIDFSQRTDDPDHCMYFAMKDAGMTSIPVYVNKDSYDIGKALGLLT